MSSINYEEVITPKEKSEICRSILNTLPEWFGIDEQKDKYCASASNDTMFAAYCNKKVVGFIAIIKRNSHTTEIDVMGVLPTHHRQGIGQSLLNIAENHLISHGYSFLLVKTLDFSSEYEPYSRTRNFYIFMGFEPQQILDGYWNSNNPCLLLSKKL